MNESERYSRYLCSREWSERRMAVRSRSGGLCERCGLNPAKHCHHLSYANKYNEPLEDLQDVCIRCHEFIHAKSNYDPKAEFERLGGLIDDFANEFIEAYESGDEISEVTALKRMTELARRRQERMVLSEQEARV